jgi:formylmethanofuran dehydrogenase subunit E
MTQPPEIFQRIYTRHGHRCPMSTLGGRLGMAALAALEMAAGSELLAVYEIDTCALDGIIETTGCQLDDGSLRVDARGAHALRLAAADGRSVRTVLRPHALKIAGEYRRLDDLYEQQRSAGAPADELRELLAERARTLQSVLEQLWALPESELIIVERLV